MEMETRSGPHPAEQLRQRTKQLAIRVINMSRTLPRTKESLVIGDQMIRSATSVGANYRAVCRARSKAEFTSKLSIVIEEADETAFWLDILIETQIDPQERLQSLISETDELLAIFSSARITIRGTKSPITKSPFSSSSDIQIHKSRILHRQGIVPPAVFLYAF
jgi:four helix bundle protein